MTSHTQQALAQLLEKIDNHNATLAAYTALVAKDARQGVPSGCGAEELAAVIRVQRLDIEQAIAVATQAGRQLHADAIGLPVEDVTP